MSFAKLSHVDFAVDCDPDTEIVILNQQDECQGRLGGLDVAVGVLRYHKANLWGEAGLDESKDC